MFSKLHFFFFSLLKWIVVVSIQLFHQFCISWINAIWSFLCNPFYIFMCWISCLQSSMVYLSACRGIHYTDSQPMPLHQPLPFLAPISSQIYTELIPSSPIVFYGCCPFQAGIPWHRIKQLDPLTSLSPSCLTLSRCSLEDKILPVFTHLLIFCTPFKYFLFCLALDT